MEKTQINQIFNLLVNREESKRAIPTYSDLTDHPVLGSHFAQMSDEMVEQVKEVINQYISERVQQFNKTKGGQLFIRFYESLPELFWRFRQLNENEETASTSEFQIVGKQVEIELFRLEGILTEKMINQSKGLDKVVESFYNIVYLFFPRFNQVA